MTAGRSGFTELDFAPTPLGELVLRRRRPPSRPDLDVYEVTLAGRFLMSSFVTASEEALAARALARLAPMDASDATPRYAVFVGGLGLGHTAATVLDDPRVAHLEVVELLPEVIGWHRRGLVPLAARLTADPRCTLVEGDAFATLRDPARRGRYDAVLIDVDDAPDDLLDPAHASFWSGPDLPAAAAALRPGGVLGVWTARPPDPRFAARFAATFADAAIEPVEFHNPLLERDDVNALYFGRAPRG